MIFVRRGPLWFRIATVVLVFWAIAGCVGWVQAVYSQTARGAGTTADYGHALYAGLPGWYMPLVAVALLTGLVGAILFFMRRAVARRFLLVSLLAIAVQVGWLVTMTDIVAHSGTVDALSFPLTIMAVAVFAIWLAGHARAKSWTV